MKECGNTQWSAPESMIAWQVSSLEPLQTVNLITGLGAILPKGNAGLGAIL
jgi:hypothetical protein